MKSKILAMVMALSFAMMMNAQEPGISHWYGLPVFSGVSGFGLDTRGGYGGRIVRVTNLNREGSGSLREALEQQGPRIIVFDVGGVINLERKSLKIINPFVTIAGQTAPSPGITIIKGGISITTHDVIMQHLKVRPGEAGQAKKSGWEVDGIGTSGGAWNVIIDHCSVTWSTDENISPSGPRFEGNGPAEWRINTSNRIVISNCIIAEGLSNSTHSKGEHSKGTLVHDNASDILIIGNLYACNVQRNPLFKGGALGVVANNYIYNPGNAAIHFGLVPDEWKGYEYLTGKMVVEGNVIEAGQDTRATMPAGSFRGPVEVVWKNNKIISGSERKEMSGDFKLINDYPFMPQGLVIRATEKVKELVLENAGAFPWDRDDTDKRIINNVRSGKGRIIDSETEVGGYPAYTPVNRLFKAEDWNLETMTKKQGK